MRALIPLLLALVAAGCAGEPTQSTATPDEYRAHLRPLFDAFESANATTSTPEELRAGADRVDEAARPLKDGSAKPPPGWEPIHERIVNASVAYARWWRAEADCKEMFAGNAFSPACEDSLRYAREATREMYEVVKNGPPPE